MSQDLREKKKTLSKMFLANMFLEDCYSKANWWITKVISFISAIPGNGYDSVPSMLLGKYLPINTE